MFVHCLADFFNLGLWPRGRDPRFPDLNDGLQDLVSAIFSALGESGVAPREVTIRLYGGWHGDFPKSGRDILGLTHAVIREFPRRVGVRLRIQIADSPVWNQSLKILNSVRRVPFSPLSGDFVTPALCAKPGDCTIGSLRSWWNGRCPEEVCGIKLADVGSTYRQKMVDTLLTADAITLVHDDMCDALVVASDDDDMLPTILAVSYLRIRAFLLRRKARDDAYYRGILELNNVSIFNW